MVSDLHLVSIIAYNNATEKLLSTLGAVAGVRHRIRRDEDTSSGLASLRTSELLLRIAGVRRNEAPRRNELPYSLRGTGALRMRKPHI